MKPQLTPYEVYRAAITNDIPKIIRQAKRERLLKRVLAIIVTCAVIAVAMSSCTKSDESQCWKCTITEIHSPKPKVVRDSFVCGKSEPEIRAFEKQWSFNNRVNIEGRIMPYSTRYECN